MTAWWFIYAFMYSTFENSFPKYCFKEDMRGHEIGPVTALRELLMNLGRLDLPAAAPAPQGNIMGLMSTSGIITSLEHSIYVAQIGPRFFQTSRSYVQHAWTVVLRSETAVADSDFNLSCSFPPVTLPPGLNSGSSPAQGEGNLFAKLAFFSAQGSTNMQQLQKEMAWELLARSLPCPLSAHLTAEPIQDSDFFCYLALESLILVSELAETENSRHPRE